MSEFAPNDVWNTEELTPRSGYTLPNLQDFVVPREGSDELADLVNAHNRDSLGREVLASRQYIAKLENQYSDVLKVRKKYIYFTSFAQLRCKSILE